MAYGKISLIELDTGVKEQLPDTNVRIGGHGSTPSGLAVCWAALFRRLRLRLLTFGPFGTLAGTAPVFPPPEYG
jgi:hypothetical protein